MYHIIFLIQTNYMTKPFLCNSNNSFITNKCAYYFGTDTLTLMGLSVTGINKLYYPKSDGLSV